MILIDAVYVHQTGGKVLFDYFVSELEKTDMQVFYLFDDRILKDVYPIKRSNKSLFLKPSFFKRFVFYYKNRKTFTKIFCFGNVPPPIKMDATVYTFFHQRMYLEIPHSLPLKTICVFKVKIKVIKFLKKNANFWIVQSNDVNLGLSERFQIQKSYILTLPFYPPIIGNEKIQRDSWGYIYVSNPFLHKNHIKLINAFCDFFDIVRKGQLTLTVDKKYKDLCHYIEAKVKNGYPIKNIGFIERNDLYKYYRNNKYLIFPSLTESFGLGIIEALENGCDVIGSDLPYTYEVCEPSLVFDPNSTQSIKEALLKSVDFNNTKRSKLKIGNQIDKILDLLEG